jgi:hypothetical protein
VDQLGTGPLDQLLDQGIAQLPVARGDLDLEQFVVGECPVQLDQDTGCDPGLADRDDRFQVVRLGLEPTALFLCDGHDGCAI